MARSAQASWATLRAQVDPFRPEVRQYLDPAHLKAQGAGLALLAQQVALQAQMLGILKAFWLIVASFVAMVPLVLLLKPGEGRCGAAGRGGRMTPREQRRAHRRAALTEGPLGRTMFFFTLPILASNVLQSLNGSVNAIWVGHYLGEAALTATSVANTILFFLLALVFGVGMAATILVGQSLGARDLDAGEARRRHERDVLRRARRSSSRVAGTFATGPLLRAMRTPADALPFATDYLRVVFAAVPFMFATTFVMMVLRGAGDARTPFYFLVLSVLLDIALNPLLIFGAGPIPRLGIAGSATATLIAQVVSLAALLIHLYRRRRSAVAPRRRGALPGAATRTAARAVAEGPADGPADDRAVGLVDRDDRPRQPVRLADHGGVRRGDAALELRDDAGARRRHGGLVGGRAERRRGPLGPRAARGADRRAASTAR